MRKGVFVAYMNSTDPDKPAKLSSLIKDFAMQHCMLQYRIILSADSESPNQTAHARSLIRVFNVRICPKALFPMTRQILSLCL